MADPSIQSQITATLDEHIDLLARLRSFPGNAYIQDVLNTYDNDVRDLGYEAWQIPLRQRLVRRAHMAVDRYLQRGRQQQDDESTSTADENDQRARDPTERGQETGEPVQKRQETGKPEQKRQEIEQSQQRPPPPPPPTPPSPLPQLPFMPFPQLPMQLPMGFPSYVPTFPQRCAPMVGMPWMAGFGQPFLAAGPGYGFGAPVYPAPTLPTPPPTPSPSSTPPGGTDVLWAWYREYEEEPYAEGEVLDDLVRRSGMDRSQVLKWFLNRRSRDGKAKKGVGRRGKKDRKNGKDGGGQ